MSVKSQALIGQKIAYLRKQARLTQSELAIRMQTSQSAIARIESGRQNPTTKTLDRLSQILGTNITLTQLIQTPSLQITGGERLRGEVSLHGAKNAALPAIAAALLASEGTSVIKNVPNIQDIRVMLEIAEKLGAKTSFDPKEKVLTINAENLNQSTIPRPLAQKIRACILYLAPLVVRLGQARLPTVGGCQIGQRKTDFHYRGFSRMHANVKSNAHFEIEMKAQQLVGEYVYLDTPSHTGTENLLMAACLAQGETLIDNAASDPEVVDLGHLLIGMGAKIEGLGTRTIRVQGVSKLHPTEHTIIPDRHDFAAFACAVAITGGTATLKNAVPENQRILEAKLQQMGVSLDHAHGNTVIRAPRRIKPINIITYPYPGFPTDAQPAFTALATLAKGKSYIRETVFENRFGYIQFLNKMGADIVIDQADVILVNGVELLQGARVKADDIRAGFGLVIAALAAHGTSTITNIEQIQRGHENVVERLAQLGAKIQAQ